MRVLQLIDSLRSGGAERMAVNYANALAKRIGGSYLCCTRMQGLLKNKVSAEVGYLFLEKKGAFDPRAFLNLRNFIKKNEIDLIQAHSSSWFLAVLVKISVPGLKVVWHDHYGRKLEGRKSGALKQGSFFFDGIISVNEDLQEWSKKNLLTEKVEFFRNFICSEGKDLKAANHSFSSVNGEKKVDIVCIANFRPQKDHLSLLKAFLKVKQVQTNVVLHLVGKDEKDSYSEKLKEFIERNDLQKNVLVHGEQENVQDFLMKMDMGVLSSRSEGLPLALLEYGLAGLPVICTGVGQCMEVLDDLGKIVPPEDSQALANAILEYLEEEQQRDLEATLFQQRVLSLFSEEMIVPDVIHFFDDILKI